MLDVVSPTSPSDQLKIEAAYDADTPRPPMTAEFPIPYTFDLGYLLLSDANSIGTNVSSEALIAKGRNCAQGIINQILTVCAMDSTTDGVYARLPKPSSALPREKLAPKEKDLTKWARFAAKKGIQAKRRDGKMAFDQESGDWVPKWGYKGKNNDGEHKWLVEVDANKERRTSEAGDNRKELRAERKERVRRQDRRQRANERDITRD